MTLATIYDWCHRPGYQLPKRPPSRRCWRPTELPGNTRTFKQFAGGDVVGSQFLQDVGGVHASHIQLVFVDPHHLVGLQYVIERHNHHVVLFGPPDRPVKAFGIGLGDLDHLDAPMPPTGRWPMAVVWSWQPLSKIAV